jgi:predicted RNA binding protein YcfA (HicA-like mRNA interferase family)
MISSKAIIRALEADGWYRVGQPGSHVHFKHRTKPGKVTVPASGEGSADWHVEEYRKGVRR